MAALRLLRPEEEEDGGGGEEGEEGGAGAEAAAAAAAAARARQRAAEEEEDRRACDEAEAEEQERMSARREEVKARQVAEGARLQVAHERWLLSAEGVSHAKQRASLPVHALEGPLKEAMARGQVAIICGETGSGKSTQVPQMLLEQALAAGRGGQTSIICTPRDRG